MKQRHSSFFLTIAWLGSALALGACGLDSTGLSDTPRGESGSGGQGAVTNGSTTGATSEAASGSGGAGAVTSGAGGEAGGGPGEPCDGKCVDPNAACGVDDTCICGVGFVDTDQAPESAACKTITTIVDVKVSVGMNHGRCGNLVLKVQGPTGEELTLMSRPGWVEAEANNTDNGFNLGPFEYGPSGDQSDLVTDFPVRFFDTAGTNAEEMGRYQDSGSAAVCRDKDTMIPPGSTTGVCEYKPNKGASQGFDTFADAFAGRDAKGQWRLCVADADGGTTGSLESFGLDIATLGGPLVKESKGLGIGIPDNVYNGTLDSMKCHTLVIP